MLKPLAEIIYNLFRNNSDLKNEIETFNRMISEKEKEKDKKKIFIVYFNIY